MYDKRNAVIVGISVDIAWNAHQAVLHQKESLTFRLLSDSDHNVTHRHTLDPSTHFGEAADRPAWLRS